jgi:hypothetical protein
MWHVLGGIDGCPWVVRPVIADVAAPLPEILINGRQVANKRLLTEPLHHDLSNHVWVMALLTLNEVCHGFG